MRPINNLTFGQVLGFQVQSKVDLKKGSASAFCKYRLGDGLSNMKCSSGFLNSTTCAFMVIVVAPSLPVALVLVPTSNIDKRKDICCSHAILIGVICSLFQ
jgi:hypothetical protein